VNPLPETYPRKMLWVTNPETSFTSGATWSAFSIEITDSYGNRTADNTSITITPSSGVLDGATTKNASDGLAIFNDISCIEARTLHITISATGLSTTLVSEDITVTPAALDHITLSPEAVTLTASATRQFTAVGYDAHNNILSGLNFTWSTVAGGGTIVNSGLFTAGTVSGTYTGTVKAISGGKTATATVTVTPGALSAIKIEDAAGGVGNEVDTSTLSSGDTLTLYAAGYDIFGNYIADQIVTWSGSGICINKLNPVTGTSTVFTTKTAGTGTIIAHHISTADDATGTITVVYSIRSVGPAGGWIFYDKGSYSDGWRYLEAAPYDQSTGIMWDNGTPIKIILSIEIGSGQQNTTYIVNIQGEGNYAAQLCNDYSITVDGIIYNDWFLPSILELSEMFKELQNEGVSGFLNSSYWSSTELSTSMDSANVIRFWDGTWIGNPKDSLNCVRAVRAF
jgi:hypothetical protein